ncbi:MAG: SAM-dependent methyltransferase [Chitinophagales bacterium]|nr:SAM-dependent methyltransferase [Chitinophagales bacterium]MDW8428132.1 SAM-dependent methyltransferase [Chitinophagales bacterium]
MSQQGTLYLIPSALNEAGDCGLSPETVQLILGLDCFVVENVRSARRFLRRIGYRKNFDHISLIPLDNDEDFDAAMLTPCLMGALPRIGLLSEAGSPAVADPGSALVRWAHEQGWRVIPLPGPSSIILALMASGLNGQQFAFHGYLPVKSQSRRQRLRELERESGKSGQTQIIMETPYRNQALMADLLDCLQPTTLLAVAAGLTRKEEYICCKPVAAWKKHLPQLRGLPCLFLFQARRLGAR